MPRIRRHVVPFRAAARHLFQTANPQLIHRHRDSVLKKLLWECRSAVVVYLWARPENAEGRVFNPGQPLSPHHQGPMKSNTSEELYTLKTHEDFLTDYRHVKRLSDECTRPKDRRAILPHLRRVERRLWRFERMMRGANLILRRCENPMYTRRPASRAPCRSIGSRTKSTRKRGGSKPASIGGDPDPVSPSRASDGGAL